MNPEITRIIEQYLANELSAADRAAFEQKLSESEALRKELDLQLQVREAAKRAAQRAIVRQTGRSYHLKKGVLTASVVVIATALIALAAYTALKPANPKETAAEKAFQQLTTTLDEQLPMENVPAEYFQLAAADTVVFSANGVLLSVPEGAFMQNGRVYNGAKVVQWQEAMDAATIVKGGLSTVSGDRLLETQGMFGLQAFTPDGKKLDVNPKVGVYVQVPVDEVKAGMQLFEGKKTTNGVIDWQNPQPLEKLPVMADMKDLDFYPPGYENELNSLKWNTKKKVRDSLYLTFEESEQQGSKSMPSHSQPVSRSDFYAKETDSIDDGFAELRINGKQLFEAKCATCHHAHIDGTGPMLAGVRSKWQNGGAKPGSIYTWVVNWEEAAGKDSYAAEITRFKPVAMNRFPELRGKDQAINAIFDYIDGILFEEHIPPAKVMAFWNPKFNNTILATRDFEKRMRIVHETCSEDVLSVYTSNMNLPIWQLDEKVAAMGYPAFSEFAAERVGAVELDNPHMNNLRHFYASSISRLSDEVKKDKDFLIKQERIWDAKMRDGRRDEQTRTSKRDAKNLEEEYNLNLRNVCRQLGQSVGFQIHGGGTVYNIDKYVMDATSARQTTVITDPSTGKTATITYNDFSVSVAKPEQYGKLFLYLFPHELNSYQRIDPVNGLFDYRLNNDIQYDLAIVGINEDSYHIYTQTGLNKGALGAVELSKTDEKAFNRIIEELNKGRIHRPMKIKDELKWLSLEQKDYKVQRLRQEQAAFRAKIRSVIFPCEVDSTAVDMQIEM